ncbi:hypothetical protein [Streptomyces sp. CBMA152]|uniref:hypothetical protein n=1 Tax=Streptomyces sp. CBMA152 TaxID=1896312 RepID=UPI0016615B82|nr:hypothetical protein [Streptomyces sp. CBMA152]
MAMLRRTRRAVPAIAAVLAGGALALSGAGSAQATGHTSTAMRPMDGGTCTGNWHYIGSPGNFFMYGEYAGQVQQLWDSSCNRTQAHWQWAGQFQSDHARDNPTVCVALVSPTSGAVEPYLCGDINQKNVSSWGWVHDGSPDDWRAQANMWTANRSCGNDAWGTDHWYGGADWAAPHDGGGC